jgi:hypothetical protein
MLCCVYVGHAELSLFDKAGCGPKILRAGLRGDDNKLSEESKKSEQSEESEDEGGSDNDPSQWTLQEWQEWHGDQDGDQDSDHDSGRWYWDSYNHCWSYDEDDQWYESDEYSDQENWDENEGHDDWHEGDSGTDPEPVAFFRPHFRGWVAPR